MNTLNEPAPATTPLTSSLDYYKLTMGDVIHERHPDTEATFTLKNRDLQRPLSQYVTASELQQQLDHVRTHTRCSYLTQYTDYAIIKV